MHLAFKGRRDLVLFTTKRILFVDKQGWSGKKMAYTTFPYSSIKIFNVATAGTMDRDCEFGFYTEVWFDPPKCNGCENGCGKLYYYIFANQIFLIFFYSEEGLSAISRSLFWWYIIKSLFFSLFCTYFCLSSYIYIFSFAQLIYF